MGLLPLDWALQQFTGQSAWHGLLVVEEDREQSQTSWQRFSTSEERPYCCNSGSRACRHRWGGKTSLEQISCGNTNWCDVNGCLRMRRQLSLDVPPSTYCMSGLNCGQQYKMLEKYRNEWSNQGEVSFNEIRSIIMEEEEEEERKKKKKDCVCSVRCVSRV